MSAHPLSGWAFIPSHPVPQPAPPLSLSILPLRTRLAAKCPLQPKAPFPKVNNYPSFLSVPQENVPTFNSSAGKELPKGGGGVFPSPGLYSPFAKVKGELVPFRKGQE